MPTMQEELEEAGFEGMWEELEEGMLEQLKKVEDQSSAF